MPRTPKPDPRIARSAAALLALGCSSCSLLARPFGGGIHDLEGRGRAAWLHGGTFGLHLGGDLLDERGEPSYAGTCLAWPRSDFDLVVDLATRVGSTRGPRS